MRERRKLLLIEEQPDLSQPLKEYLEESGFFVTTCQKIEQVSCACKSTAYDLVLIDIDTLQTSWLDLIEMLIEGLDIIAPIVILTQSMDTQRLSEALRSGVSDFIIQPCEPKSLVSFVNRQIAKSKRKTLDFELTHALRKASHSYLFYPQDYFEHSITQYVFSDIQKCLKMHPLKRNEIFLILEEAISNAFFHGIWQLTTDEYHLDKESLIRLITEKNNGTATEHFVKVDITIDKQENMLEIIVKDSGEGFDYQGYLSNMQSDIFHQSLSGRGLLLIKTLSEKMSFSENGSEIRIEIIW